MNLIQLPSEGAACHSGMQLVASGWGMDRYMNQEMMLDEVPSTRFLKAIKLECLDITKCPAYGDADPSLVFCLGDPFEALNSVCYGDSGGKGLK